jgi:NhaP-type Na+/H+ or K+/H+ antiporter
MGRFEDVLIGLIIGIPLGICLGWLLARGLSGESPRYKLRNTEEIAWTDWRGKMRLVTIHREVE